MKYNGPKCRLCRREGIKLFLKGERCLSPKCAMTKRNYPPGQHTKSFGKMTEYARQLREKQKAKRIYNLTEEQFSHYYTNAVKKKGSVTGDLMFSSLESRLDNVLYRIGLADSRSQARQWVSHGLIRLNGRRITIPSMPLKPGDKFEVVERVRNSPVFTRKKEQKGSAIPWAEFDYKQLKGSMARLLEKDDLPAEVDAQLIVEFYSR